MKMIYCLTGILCLFLKSNAQEIKPLTIGDKVPDAVIKNIYNYPALQSSISAFNNKLLILNFMATNCISCLKALPRFASLQNEYGDKIQIVLVTNQSAEKIKTFLRLRPEVKLPIVSGDSVLSKLFPHTFISHEVWIKEGVVKAITYADYVNKTNIETILSDKKINWPVKRDMAEFDYSKPLLRPEADLPEDNLSKTFYSLVTPYMAGIPAKYTTDSNNNAIRVSVINFSLINLYLKSYNRLSIPKSQLILEVKDRSRIYNKETGNKRAWREKNTYCYESVLPANMDRQTRQDKMRSDLDFYFGMHGRIEKRKVPCYIIKKIIPDNSLKATKVLVREKAETRKMSLTALLFLLNEHYATPFINATGQPDETQLEVEEKVFSDISVLKKSLEKYGMEMITAIRETDILILTEK